jgi:hypothetical protein
MWTCHKYTLKRSLRDVALNTQNSEFDPELGHTPLTRAVQWLFQPLARMLMRKGVGGNSTVEMCKRAYVAATIDVLKERGLPVTRARLEIFTGFPGRVIDSITQALNDSVDVEPSKFDSVTHLLTTWHLDDRYALQFMATPRELKITGPAGEYTFTTLAKECAPTVDPDELLEELMRIGAVTVDGDKNTARLIARAYLPEPYSPEQTERLGRMVRNFATTLESNFQTEDPNERRLDRHVMADFAISREDEAEFANVAREAGQAFLETLDSWLQKRKQVRENGRRVGVNVFYYIEVDESVHAGDEGTGSHQKDEKADSSDVYGPYFMGVLEPPIVEGRSDGRLEKNRDDDADDDDVIDVLDYRGPKK